MSPNMPEYTTPSVVTLKVLPIESRPDIATSQARCCSSYGEIYKAGSLERCPSTRYVTYCVHVFIAVIIIIL